MKRSEAEKKEAIEQLLEILKPGDTVQTILRHVSRSGMMRHISFRAHDRDITYWVGIATGTTATREGVYALKVGGCGMDMGFAVVYELGATLWPRGTDKPHGYRNGELDSDGGYALKQTWI